METIKEMRIVEACNAKDYQESLNREVDALQALNLAVEVSHSMSCAQKGVGYMYSAVVVGRQK